MCSPLIRDSNNVVYLLGVEDNGLPFLSTATNFPNYKGTLLPILASSSGKSWAITAGIDGTITATETPLQGMLYIPLTSIGGFSFKFFITDTGNPSTLSTGKQVLPDSVPRPLDVTMSVWPVSAGVICYSCGNASVTVGADFSAWCCACSAFVSDDDTNIIIQLEE